MKKLVIGATLLISGCVPGGSGTSPSSSSQPSITQEPPSQPISHPTKPDKSTPGQPPPQQPPPQQPPPQRPTPEDPTKKPENQEQQSCNAVRDEFNKLPQYIKYSATDAEMKAEFIHSHNQVRDWYRLPKLVWDDAIAQYAQAWANYLRDTYSCKMHHRSNLNRRDGKNWGENLAYSWRKPKYPGGEFSSSPSWAALGWSNECKDYSYETNECNPADPKEMCGHFTQMVWKDTKRFGCGMAECDEGEAKSEVWVCNYDPAGNITMIYPDGRKEKLKPY